MKFPMGRRMTHITRSCVLVPVLLFALGTSATAQTPAPPPARLSELSLEELLGVTVQPVFGASDRLQPVTEAPASVTIITADDIRRYGYRSLADILRGVRGFFVTDDRNYSYVGVRGVNRPGDYNTRVLLLLNGHRVNDSVYDMAYIGAELGIDVAMFERVEIIRGPASALYGTSAFFAVINVITRSGGAMKGASISVEAGTLGMATVRSSFGHEFASGASLALSGTVEGSQGMGRLYFPSLDTPDNNNGVAEDLDGEGLRSAYAQLRWRGLAVTVVDGWRRKNVPTAPFGSLFNSQDPPVETVDRRTTVQAAHESTVGATRIVADISFDRLDYRSNFSYRARADSPAVTNYGTSTGARWGGSVRAGRGLPGRQTLTAGVEFVSSFAQRQGSRYDDPEIPRIDLNTPAHQVAFFAQNEIRVQPWLLLSAGLRHDRHERYARTTPRGAVIVMPSANQSFKYLYGRAFRAPNAYELYYFDDATSRLQPESIATHELAWERYQGEWLRTSVSAYKSEASGLISFRPLDINFLGYGYGFVNDQRISSRGLELEAELRSRRGHQLLGSMSFQHVANIDRTPVTNAPARVAQLRLSMPGPFAGSIGSMELQYLGPRGTRSGTHVGAAALAHATLNARISRSLDLTATIRNVFDQRYADPASAEQAFNSIEQNGRTARVGLRFSWGRR